MRPAIFSILLLFLLLSCDQRDPQHEPRSTPVNQDSSPVAEKPAIPEMQPPLPGAFEDLRPVALIKPGAKDVYERYGIDFSGNCYECDLAAISIRKNLFELTNVCNKADQYRVEHFSFRPGGDTLTIHVGESTLTFTMIDPVPVYELKITGEKININNKKLSKYYTTVKQLVKFKQHDCGEFDG